MASGSPPQCIAICDLDRFPDGLGEPIDAVPPVEASNLVSYLVLQTGFVTSKQFKANNYKSLNAYN